MERDFAQTNLDSNRLKLALKDLIVLVFCVSCSNFHPLAMFLSVLLSWWALLYCSGIWGAWQLIHKVSNVAQLATYVSTWIGSSTPMVCAWVWGNAFQDEYTMDPNCDYNGKFEFNQQNFYEEVKKIVVAWSTFQFIKCLRGRCKSVRSIRAIRPIVVASYLYAFL